MRLKDLIDVIDCRLVGLGGPGLERFEITGISYDSREITGRRKSDKEGPVFVALRGEHAEGIEFSVDAVKRGAVAVLTEKPAEGASFPQIIVPDVREAMARLSDIFYGTPSRDLVIVGITGTNGKTTASYLVESILKEAGYSVGVISTVNYRFNGHTFPAPYTTPEAPVLHRVLSEMKDAGVTHCVMEVSSHSLAQKRVDGLEFKAACFTNLTQDHLDFHHTMEEYFKSKARLFKELNAGEAVINVDDEWGRRLEKELPGRVLSYSLRDVDNTKIFPQDYSLRENCIEATVSTPDGTVRIRSPLVGEYNLGNILASVGVGCALGIDTAAISRGIGSLSMVAGRLERVEADGKNLPRAYVDYAHTPDALERVLTALRRISTGRIITVFGCGGNRDRMKRPLMGEAAVRLSTVTIITSDNPRDEEPQEIIKDIEAGVEGVRKVDSADAASEKYYMVIPDRFDAIKEAISIANAGDTVLVAGKGHEDYQIIKGEKHLFDDVEAVKTAMNELGKRTNDLMSIK